MSIHQPLSHRSENPARRWALIVPILLAAAALFAFIGISRAAAQGTNPVFFTNCATNTGNNATIVVPGTAPQMHTAGYFTPVAGDEFAVFRPVGGTCATSAPSLCAGAMVWPGQGANEALTVWGDNPQVSGIDGMLVGEMMCWKVWDASENQVYTATVEYDPNPPFNSTGLYAVDGLYALMTLSPTILELVSFQAGSSPVQIQRGVLWAGSFILIGSALVIFQFRRRR